MNPQDEVSVLATGGIVVASVILAWASSHYGWVLGLAVSVSALGGLTHEIAQSGGKVLVPRMCQDGLYLGSLAGMVLGIVAGLLVVRGALATDANGLAPSTNFVQLTYEIFIAGLALKGVTEAASGKAVP